MKRRFALLAVLCSGSVLFPQLPTPNVESFDLVWKTVRDKTWDPELGGVDWVAVYKELRPKMQQALTVKEGRQILTDMLGRLKLSHFSIIPGDVYAELGAGNQAPPGDGVTGIDVRVLDGEAVVTSVDPGSAAAKAGISPGWIVRKIDTTEVKPLIARVLQQNAGVTYRDLLLRRAILLRMQGAVGESAHIGFLDAHDEPVYKNLVRGEPRGKATQFGFLGASYVWLDSRRLKADTVTAEYIAFNMFLDPAVLMPEFGSAVQSCLQCDGFVLDLRGNPGGLGAMATGMAGWFIDRQDAMLGTMILRDTALKFVINPRPETYAGPLAILVDGSSASTSEILAGGLQDLKRARIFGSKTAAAALPSVIERLPNGDAFQYAIANYVSAGGKTLEGAGVTPDTEAPATRAALLAHHDPPLDAAVEWIRTQKQSHE